MYLSSFEISLQSTDDDSFDYNQHTKLLNSVHNPFPISVQWLNLKQRTIVWHGDVVVMVLVRLLTVSRGSSFLCHHRKAVQFGKGKGQWGTTATRRSRSNSPAVHFCHFRLKCILICSSKCQMADDKETIYAYLSSTPVQHLLRLPVSNLQGNCLQISRTDEKMLFVLAETGKIWDSEQTDVASTFQLSDNKSTADWTFRAMNHHINKTSSTLLHSHSTGCLDTV